jgi:hypothetical protein
MDFRAGRTPAVSASVGAAGLASAAVEPGIPPAVAKRIAKAVESSRSEGTRRTYAAGWRRFAGWCAREGHIALPAHPVTVAAYLVDAADTRTETGERAYAVATFGTGSRRSTISTAPPDIYPRPPTSLSPRRCRGSGGSMPRRGIGRAPRGIRCWSTTSRSSSRPRGNGAAVGPTKCWSAATRRFCCLGSRARSAVASCRTSCVATLPCIGTTASTSAYESRRPTKKAEER